MRKKIIKFVMYLNLLCVWNGWRKREGKAAKEMKRRLEFYCILLLHEPTILIHYSQFIISELWQSYDTQKVMDLLFLCKQLILHIDLALTWVFLPYAFKSNRVWAYPVKRTISLWTKLLNPVQKCVMHKRLLPLAIIGISYSVKMGI